MAADGQSRNPPVLKNADHFAGERRSLLPESGKSGAVLITEMNNVPRESSGVSRVIAGHTPHIPVSLPSDSNEQEQQQSPVDFTVFRTYRRRWIGVAIICVLNFMSAFSILVYAPVSDITRQYFGFGSLTPINWLYIGCAFVYVIASPVSVWIIERSAKAGLVVGAFVLIFASWLRYVGIQLKSYPCLLLGSMLCGASQAFALNIPSHFSDLWFPDNGRLTATALMTLANPLGQAIGTLVVPLMATTPAELGEMTLYVAVLFTLTTWFAILTPARPPTPPSITFHTAKPTIRTSLSLLKTNKDFFYLFLQFSILVASFNAFASLTEQFVAPYGFSDIQAGIIGAAMVVFGLLFGAICAPILDYTKAWKFPIIAAVSGSALAYLGLIFAIRSFSIGSFACIIILVAVIGGAGLMVLPLAIEVATDITYPIPPELTSSLLWMGGQGFGGVFILIIDALRSQDKKYTHGLIFLIVMASIPIPFAVLLTKSKNVAYCRAKRNSTSPDDATPSEVTTH